MGRERLEHLGMDCLSLWFGMVCMHPWPCTCPLHLMHGKLSITLTWLWTVSFSTHLLFWNRCCSRTRCDTETAVEFLESNSGWLAFTIWHQEVGLETSHLFPLYLEGSFQNRSVTMSWDTIWYSVYLAWIVSPRPISLRLTCLWGRATAVAVCFPTLWQPWPRTQNLGGCSEVCTL